MSAVWAELSTMQRRLLIRLGNGRPNESPIGIEVAIIMPELVAVAASLCLLGLVQETRGSHGSVWLRITKAGEKVRDSGRL